MPGEALDETGRTAVDTTVEVFREVIPHVETEFTYHADVIEGVLEVAVDPSASALVSPSERESGRTGPLGRGCAHPVTGTISR
ncbi:hypothetical protein Hrd1104_01145 [Halorhabdus sp. CBA1104]|uniref:hypothetical protein n=1 Tax=unclassified Halorhabdus TaxID=2621901 RepID=UPI0012B47C50|nr:MULTISPECIES: hypothetical protein [unclassified Halorhabdus]QGN06031.1 hypothetical protein Hrd1104_01145 [Halorhabdus sp. CBA1104]